MDLELDETRRLVGAARSGSREAYEQLFRMYREDLERRARAHLGPRASGIDASDLVQETLTDAVRGFERFEPRGAGSFRGWLARILENRLLQVVRAEKREKRDTAREEPLVQSGGSAAAGTPRVQASATSPSQGAVRREEREQIEGALAALPPDQAEVIRLVKLEELRLDEVAQRMGRSENAVKKLLARALLRLRGELGSGSGT